MLRGILILMAAFITTRSVAAAAAAAEPISPVPFNVVKVQDGFWLPRFETNRKVTVWYDFKKCEETGRIDNFPKAAGLMKGEFRGTPWDDSDVYKVIEGAAYTLATNPDPKLDAYLDDLIAKIAAAQEPDGYIYTARRLFAPEKMPQMSGPQRWSNLQASHELYNVGHMYEAAVAHFQATGKRTFLNVAIKNADFLLTVFGPGKNRYVPGHEEIEIGLVRLYRVTGNQKYLDLAKFYIDERGRADGHKLYGDNQQDHKPFALQEEAVGHAVRAGYLYTGAADVASLNGDQGYLKALDKIWESCVHRRMYLTGGIGAHASGEAFGKDYDLPNKQAYNETCAAIANGLWNQRMFLLHGDAKYIDVLERVIYNGFLSGISLSGDRFFYPNPLESDGTERQAWFGCSCCPVNVVRFVPSIAGYIYATRGKAIYVNLFVGGTGEIKVGEQTVKITQETNYPWDGKVRIKVEPQGKVEGLTLYVRIPGWARGEPVPGGLYRYTGDTPAVKATLAGKDMGPLQVEKGFLPVRHTWQAGDALELDFPMPIRRAVADEKVTADAGRVALERGPIVYCLEGIDNGGSLKHLVLPDSAELKPARRDELLGGVTVLGGKAQAKRQDGTLEEVALTAIPYYAWANRGKTPMTVWVARDPALVPTPAKPTVASLSKLSSSHTWERDTLAALNDQIEPKKSADESMPRFTWWDHRGSKEWVQYDFAKPTKVAAVEVYWFDDTGKGSCRVPQSWRVLYKAGEQWKEVEGKPEYGTKVDGYNRAGFAPVETSALRLEVQLQKEMSGGVLEWRVE